MAPSVLGIEVKPDGSEAAVESIALAFEMMEVKAA